MPDVGKIMQATEPADVAQLAMIEALRQIADTAKRTAAGVEGVQAEVRDVRERLIRIEASEFKAELAAAKGEIERLRTTANAELEALDTRLDALELERAARSGAKDFADALLKYGPFAIALITALFVVLVATGRIVL